MPESPSQPAPQYFPSEFGLQAQLAEVRREINKRRQFYPTFIATGKLSRDQADRQFAAMEAVALTLQKLLSEDTERRQPSLFPK